MAKKHPQALFAEFPVSPTSYDSGYRKINYENLANAVNGAAWWIRENLGAPKKEFETLAYIGLNDPRYNILVLAAVKTGYKAAALLASFINGIANQSSWIYPPAAAIPSAKLVADALKHTKADVLAIPPPVVVDLARQPEIVEFVASSIDTLVYGGGDLPEAIGASLIEKLRLMSVYGATEFGLPAAIRTSGKYPSQDWQYVHFHPEIGVKFEHVSENLYELQFIRHPDIERHQPMFKLFPHLQVYKTSDLYTPHPSKPDLWMYKGRSDDIIVFLTGEKTNPTSFEHHLATHPDVKAALIAGTRRFQASLLVELVDEKELSSEERAIMIEKLWPIVQEANQVCPAHAKVAKTHILLINPKKPMARAGKGTVQRQSTITLYTNELDTLYSDAEKIKPTFDQSIEKLTSLTIENISSLIERFIKKQAGWDSIDRNANFYLMGLDSIQTLLLVRHIKQSIELSEIAPSTIYANPSVSELSRAILDLSSQTIRSSNELENTRLQAIDRLILKHLNTIDELASASITKEILANSVTGGPGVDHVVILTGSTGSLGSYLLHVLLENPSVSHIYCLNRSSDSASLQSQRNKSRGLPPMHPSNRLTFLEAQLGEDGLGLDRKVYLNLIETTTDIILNGWTVDFNIPLSAFDQQLASIVNFSRFASQARYSPTILFVSSISSVKGSATTEPLILEKIFTDHSAPLSMGYGESKYVAERLLDYSAEKLFIDARIARVGQIAGPVHAAGAWNKWEWLPSLIISSLHVGALPDSLGSSMSNIDWVPIDVLAEVLVELTFNSKPLNGLEGNASVFHPHNPRTTSWSQLLPTIAKVLSTIKTKPIEVISFQSWLQRIHADMESSDFEIEEGIKRNPAIKLLNTYESLLKEEQVSEMATEKAQAASSKLRGCEAVNPEWVQKWCTSWFEGKTL
ncbi:putative linear gramicidin synthase subunit D [Tricladium varicosporioides]|nr:putative linear gramicidin synthase subunit D [Hymenoscyphus varicosporioides]